MTFLYSSDQQVLTVGTVTSLIRGDVYKWGMLMAGAHADPAGVLPAWLKHATRGGRSVPAGTVVTTGAWGGLHPWTGDARGTLSMAGLGEFSFSAAA